MAKDESLGSFLTETRDLLKDYIETRAQIYRLTLIGIIARSAGLMAWIVVAAFLFFLLVVFGGLVTGFWLSSLLGSYVFGFGLTAVGILILIGLVTVCRNFLFVNPIIRKIIRITDSSGDITDK
jgi:hypothetical protein